MSIHRKIVILGAGFAGIRVAQDLGKNFFDPHYSIILIDRYDAHVFHADLYEVATAFNRKITEECLTELRDTVATPISDLIDLNRVKFIRDEILDILDDSREVVLKRGGKIHYDYLVVALGSDTNYFNIPGLRENSFSLKTVDDAIEINCHLDQLFQDLWKRKIVRDVYITVGGGGATGVETAGELVNCIRCLSQKYHYPPSRVTVQLIEGSDSLVGLPKKGRDIILKRYKQMGIKVYLKRYISKVTESKIVLKLPDGSTNFIDCDFLIWTGGVMVNSIVQKALGAKFTRGAVKVNPFLQSDQDRNIFVAGDVAYFNWHGSPLPMLAQIAFEQGTVVAENIVNLINGKPLRRFEPTETKLLVPLGGKFAISVHGECIRSGFFPWLLKRFVYFRYAWSILPFVKAFRKLNHSTRVFMEND